MKRLKQTHGWDAASMWIDLRLVIRAPFIISPAVSVVRNVHLNVATEETIKESVHAAVHFEPIAIKPAHSVHIEPRRQF
jgi:hypothetical protein